MKLHLEWSRPLLLKDATAENLVFKADLSKIPAAPGIYVFGRRWGSQFEALYVGKAANLRGRVKSHFNNLRLMQHVKNARNGRRVVLIGKFVSRPGQQVEKCLRILERGFIRHFLSEGHDLVNKQGTAIRRHEFVSTGRHPRRVFPNSMYVEKAKGE
ncbi:MAG: GIY-YIG nuclease family protein [Pseudomonadota bacterium]|nr:GIY-YIG nuclease family protein [Pseudomonadota bacterium]